MIQDNTKQITSEKIIALLNEAYDRGGEDVLKLIMETVYQIAVEKPELKSYVGFTIHVVEVIRQTLADVVSEQNTKLETKICIQ